MRDNKEIFYLLKKIYELPCIYMQDLSRHFSIHESNNTINKNYLIGSKNSFGYILN